MFRRTPPPAAPKTVEEKLDPSARSGQAPKTVEEQLDIIIHHLNRMDRRDRLRMWSSVFHSLLTIVPIVFFAWSIWYLYAHFDDIMGSMMEQSAKSAAAATGQGYEDILKQLKETFGIQGE